MKQYIDKAALVERLNKMIKSITRLLDLSENRELDINLLAKVHAYEDMLDFIHTLEVKEVDLKDERMKEVDLEKELDFNAEVSKFIDTFYKNTKIGHKLMIRRTARYFYELGIKAKGE